MTGSIAHRLLGWGWYIAAAIIVVTAVGVSVMRLLLPTLHQYHAEVEKQVAAFVELPVRIGEVRAGWRGLRPILILHDLNVYAEAEGPSRLRVREVRIALNLWQSLRTGMPQLGGLTVVGTELELERTAEGRVHVRAFADTDNGPDVIGMVLGQPRFSLFEARIRWLDAQSGDDWQLEAVELHALNRDERHQLQGSMQLPEVLGRQLSFAADAEWNPEDAADRSGMIYIDGSALQLAPWTRRLPDAIGLRGQADARLWVTLTNGVINDVRGEVAAAPVRVFGSQAEEKPDLEIETFASRFAWQREADQWRLALRDLIIGLDGRQWPATDVDLRASAQAQGVQAWDAQFAHIEIDDISRLVLATDFPDVATRAWLGALQPHGELRDLRMSVTTADKTIREMAFRAGILDAGNRTWQRMPGIAGVHGSIEGTLDAGTLDIASGGFDFDNPDLFRAPLQVTHLAGRLQWQRTPESLRIETGLLEARNADIETRTRLTLTIPQDDSGAELDMQVGFVNGNMARVGPYLPAGIMPPATVTWLDRALVGGRITSGGMLFHGPLAAFPFDGQEGEFQVLCNVEDAILDYAEGWTRIEELAAEVVFHNRAMTIKAVSGKILNADLQPTQVDIEDLTHAVLKVRGNARGPLADMLRVVRESPLSDAYGDALGPVVMEGVSDLRLALDLTLYDHQIPAVVDGEVKFDAGNVRFPDWDLALEGLTGGLQFTADKLTARKLTAQLLGKPVQVELTTAGDHAQRETQVDVRGPLPLAARLRKADWSPLLSRITGDSDWWLQLRIPHSDGGEQRAPVQLALQSDLRGVAVALPGTLGKVADTARLLRIDATILGHEHRPIYFAYGDALRGAMQLVGDAGATRLQRGELRFGATQASLPEGEGMRIAGELERLVVADWQPLLGGAADRGAGVINEVDLHAGSLEAFNRVLESVGIQARREPQSWRIQFNAPQLAGVVLWPDNVDQGGRVALNFQRLHLPPVIPSESEKKKDDVDPRKIPGLDLLADDFIYGKLNLGRVELHTTPQVNGMRVDQLTTAGDWLQVDASGEWVREADVPLSRFEIAMQGKDLGYLLKSFGYAGGIKDGATKGKLSANWKGAPADFALAKLEGRMQVEVGEGRLVDVEPGAGRIFGLFSLQSLPRRLSLDFSDLVKKGLSFDHISGSFTLSEGNAFTDDLKIDAPSANIEISGRTGLAVQDYDQLVTVTPQVGSSIPLAGALAGGPGVGAALLLADKIFPRQMGELTRFTRQQYSLTGSWDDPQYKRIEKNTSEPAHAGESVP